MSSTLSLTFAPNGSASVTASFSESTPTSLLHAQIPAGTGGQGGVEESRGSVLAGCEDGSIYVLHSGTSSNIGGKPEPTPLVITPPEVSPLSPLLSPTTRRHPPHNTRPSSSSPRSLSPASTKSPAAASYSPFFHVAKPRAVSGVSGEQAEAPKNYVDFEEEQEKMKGMLRRKGVKDKTVMDSLMPGVEKKAFAPSSSSNSASDSKCADSNLAGAAAGRTANNPSSSASSSSASSASASSSEKVVKATTPVMSPTSSTYSLSRPASTTNVPSIDLPRNLDATAAWGLTCHTIPPERARLSPVVCLKRVARHPLALCLHEIGEVGVYSLVDGSCQVSAPAATAATTTAAEGTTRKSALAAGAKAKSKLPLIWHWKSLHVVALVETFLVVVCATSEATVQSPEMENDHSEDTRYVAFELDIERAGDPDGISLTKIGDWALEGPVQGVALHGNSDGQIHLLHVDDSRHLIKQRVSLSEKVAGTESPLPAAGSTANLPLPNPFKVLKGLRSTENLIEEQRDDASSRISLVETLDLGLLPLTGSLAGIRFDSVHYLASGLAWSDQELLLFDVSGFSAQVLGIVPLVGVVDVLRHGHNLVTVKFEDRMELRKLSAAGSTDSQTNESTSSHHVIRSSLIQSQPLLDVDVAMISAPSEFITTRKKNSRRRLESFMLGSPENQSQRVLWKAGRVDVQAADKKLDSRVSALLPVKLNYLVLGYADGFVEQTSLTSLVQRKPRGSSGRMSEVPLPGVVTTIDIVRVERTNERRLIVGADDGSIAIFPFDSMQLLARWTVFLEPLREVIHVSSGRLRGCVLCVSQDGCIAVIALDGCEYLYLVPASVAPLEKICVGGDNLLLAYADKRTRLWDVKTREFWRSMTTDKADEMIKQGGWTEWVLGSSLRTRGGISSLSGVPHLPDAGSTVILDIDELLLSLSVGPLNSVPAVSQPGPKDDHEAKRVYLRSLLSALLTDGLNKDIDQTCREKLQISTALFGICRSAATTIYAAEGPREPWSIGPDVSALHSMSIVALLHALGPYEDKPDTLHTISTIYSASIGQIVGSSYHSPSLTLLARIWLHAKATDLSVASRQLFDAGIARLSDDQVNSLVESWHGQLPSSQSEAKRDSTTSALALFICGSVAVDKYTLLSSTALTDIAKSISLYLHDEHSPHRSLAIDLCSRGFPVWQQHVDAVEILRSLFALATSGKKDPGSNVGQQARSAVLLIASGNSPLFMTTVSMDILQPKSVQHRKSVMQLVIFLIHKRPLVLYSNLPRLVEAVVKSLDPNSNANRDAVLDSATEILGHLVETYPTVDFHGPSQRLAIGTSEGAVVMYDLKTATRLYVLEGHTKRTTACAFSPDGRRLVTLSLEEHTVLIWKVGSSFTSFFMPGAPPRQGHGGSDPYKTYDFNIGDEGDMTLAATLDLVKFDWPSERSENDWSSKLHHAVAQFCTCQRCLSLPPFLSTEAVVFVVPSYLSLHFSAGNGVSVECP